MFFEFVSLRVLFSSSVESFSKLCYTYFTVSGVLPSTISFNVQCMEGTHVEEQYFLFKT